ncbi:MAG: nitrate- and nitrite sensing domain-containing protein, partial [Desulfuromonadaceae bacterium]
MLKNWSIRTKLLLLASIPILFLLYFNVTSMFTKVGVYRELKVVAEQTKLTTQFGDLVHELQKERGMSAGFLGSKGGKFVAELPEQRKICDIRVENLKTALDSFGHKHSSVSFGTLAGSAMGNLDKINSIRSGVTSQSIEASEAIKYYTETIDFLLKIPADLSLSCGNVKIATLASSYSYLMQAKEMAGIERAALSNTFARDSFAPGFFNVFVMVVAKQETYLGLFQSYANESQKKLFAETLTGSPIEEVARLRTIAMEKGHKPSLGGIEAPLWFDMSTKRIDMLKVVENQLGKDLLEKAGDLMSSTRVMMLILVVVTVCAVAMTLLFALLILQAELEQQKSKEKLSLILNSAAEAIYGIDKDGHCTFCNQACIDMLGYESEDELLGTNMHDQIHHTLPDGSHFPVHECKIFKAIQRGEGTHVDDEFLWRKDGTSFPAEYWSYPQHKNGKISGAVISFFDIGARKKVEEKLAELSHYFITSLENTSDFIYFKDANGCFRFCSQAMATITGHTSWRDIIGKKDRDIFPEETASIYYKEELHVLSEGRVLLNKEEPYYDASGNLGWISTSKWPLFNPEGEVTGLFGISRDITERKLTEENLRTSNKHNRIFAENATEIVWTMSQSGAFTYVSPSVEKVMGY